MAWTSYGVRMLLGSGLNCLQSGITTSTTFRMALFLNTGNPAGTPVEVTTSGYSRQSFTFAVPSLISGNTYATSNPGIITFSPLSAVITVRGAAVLDQNNFTILWNDFTAASNPSGGGFVFPVGSFVGELIG